ncbi:MAG: SH3 domain-containing protein [Pseudomonadota bacterium]|nr:SH3 domain-containing protein [Pseudomonadota bacterium]
MKWHLLVLGAGALAAGALAQGEPSGEAQDGVCAFSGWSGDPDLAGLNVRAAPSPTARLIGRLPPPERIEGRDFATVFDVVEARNGWFRIENARRWDDDSSQPASLPSGWISGRFLQFQLGTDKAFAEPDPASAVVATAWRDSAGERHDLGYSHPTACRGEWVKLTVTGHDGRAREAWVRGVCGNQETTCDGVPGDLIDYEDLPRH